MKKEYDIENLVSASIFSVIEENKTLMEDVSEQRFIFEKRKNIFGKTQYHEIFTDIQKKLELDNHGAHFCFAFINEEYITDLRDLEEYLTPEEIKAGKISKLRLLQIYNNMNFKEKGSVKSKTTSGN